MVSVQQADKGKTKTPEPPKTIEEALKLIGTLQTSLHDANQEAARRRVELKQQKGKGSDEGVRLKTLENEVVLLRAEKSFDVASKKAGVLFANDKASQDAFNYAQALMSREDDAPATFEEALSQVLVERPYLVKKVKPVDNNDAVKGDAKGNLAIDEDEIASRFGIRQTKPKGEK